MSCDGGYPAVVTSALVAGVKDSGHVLLGNFGRVTEPLCASVSSFHTLSRRRLLQGLTRGLRTHDGVPRAAARVSSPSGGNDAMVAWCQGLRGSRTHFLPQPKEDLLRAVVLALGCVPRATRALDRHRNPNSPHLSRGLGWAQDLAQHFNKPPGHCQCHDPQSRCEELAVGSWWGAPG